MIQTDKNSNVLAIFNCKASAFSPPPPTPLAVSKGSEDTSGLRDTQSERSHNTQACRERREAAAYCWLVAGPQFILVETT